MKAVISIELAEAVEARSPADIEIDAFVTEPLPTDSPLWSIPNLFVTPHISWSSLQTHTRTVDLFLENLHRYRTGQPLLNIVDRHAGY